MTYDCVIVGTTCSELTSENNPLYASNGFGGI
jgi:hypothetical protein